MAMTMASVAWYHSGGSGTGVRESTGTDDDDNDNDEEEDDDAANGVGSPPEGSICQILKSAFEVEEKSIIV